MEARYGILAFLDDDTIPKVDFVKQVSTVFDRFPGAGAVGGKIAPEYLGSPSRLVDEVAGFALAICDRGDEPMIYEGLCEGPVTAGMCIRTELMRKIAGDLRFVRTVSGAVGNVLLRGEDTAIVVRVLQLGYSCAYDPSLSITHVIPESRTTPEYLARLYEGIGRGQAAVRKLYDWKARTVLSWVIGLKDLVRWAAGRVRGAGGDGAGTDMHDLGQRQVLGRALQALRWPRG